MELSPSRSTLAFLLPLVVAVLVAIASRLPAWPRHGEIYVSPQGSNWSSGRTIDAPVATIQYAADMADPGESIILLPGVYHEEVRLRRGGKTGKPVSIRAINPGTVTISGAAPDSVVDGLIWRDEGDKIWSAQAPWPVYHAIGDDENFFHVRWADGVKGDNVYHGVGTQGRVARLRELTQRPNSWGAFTYEQGRVYVAFRDGRSPKFHELQINRPVPRPYASWSLRAANVWVEADHIRFEGIRFHLGVGAGLLLWNARHVEVVDSMFTGAVFGVSNFPSISRPNGLLVEHSFYNNYPQNEWSKTWLSGSEVYSHHSNSTLVAVTGDGIVLRNNLVTHAGDGLEVSTPDAHAASGIQIYGNLLAHGTDDGIELDGHAARVHIHHNLVYDFSLSLGISPVLSGPVLIQRNLFLHPPDGKLGAHLKLMNPWQKQGGDASGPIQNVMVADNLFSGKWLAFSSSPTRNVHVAHNVFLNPIMDQRFGFPPDVITQDNEYIKATAASDGLAGSCKMMATAHAKAFASDLAPAFAPLVNRDKALQKYQLNRPGPMWLDYEKFPASREVKALADQWVKEASSCG